MKLFVRSVLLLGFIVVTFQDITERRGCACSKCKGVDNKINAVVGKKIDGDGGKSGCNICEQRKEMLRLERERQRQLQKCPFEILGSPGLKGKASDEIFDEFRELLVPSQNGFFDMMRGIVKTMHFSSEAELKWAKEKEARELAKKRKEKEEEAKRRKEVKSKKGEIVDPNNPISPKVTVVLKQTPCGQVVPPNEKLQTEQVSLMKRLPKEASSALYKSPEEEVLELQALEFGNNDQAEKDYLDLNSKENFLHSNLVDRFVGFNTLTSVNVPSGKEQTGSTRKPEGGLPPPREGSKLRESSTLSRFMKLIRAPSGVRNPEGNIDTVLNATSTSKG